MALADLNADNIGDLDNGHGRALINAALATLMKDIEDRAAQDGKPRVLEIKLTFVHDHGNVLQDLQVSAKIPAYRSNNTVGKIMQKHARGGIVNVFSFQEEDAENPDQNTFEFGEGEGQKPA